MNFKLCHFESSDNDCTDNVGFQVVFCQLSFFLSLALPSLCPSAPALLVFSILLFFSP